MTKKIVFEERVKIEVGIIKEESFKSIAKDLGRSASSMKVKAVEIGLKGIL